MRPMNDPSYYYQPWDERRRQRASRSHRRRLGIPDGHRQVYGFHVPEEHAEPMRYWATALAGKFGRERAEEFVGEQVKSNYRDIAKIREAWLLKLDAAEVREAIRSIWEAIYYAD